MPAQPATHPTPESLAAFSQGKLDEPNAEAVLDHLRSCSQCRAQLHAMTGPGFIDRLVQTLQVKRRPNAVSISAAARNLFTMLATPDTPPLLDLPPELARDSHYEVLRELGRGGMGVVYLARHRLYNRLEVLKVMNKELVANQENKDRFLREIKSAARLDHPNVVKMHTASDLDHLMVLVMEYVEGEDLAKRLDRGPLPVLNACYYAHQVALGLQEAHDHQMVHRDIKPQNLIVAKTAKKHLIKILDFGLAKVVSENRTSPDLTGTGMLLGTPHYMAPEQATDAAKADIRADIYSLGCTLYHMLAGTTPFTGKSAVDVIFAHRDFAARAVEQHRPEISTELAAVVAKMMAKKPEDRFQTPAEVGLALLPFIKAALESKAAQSNDTLPPEPSGVASGTVAQSSPFAATLGTGQSLPDSRRISDRSEEPQANLRKKSSKPLLIGAGIVISLFLMAAGVYLSDVIPKTKDGIIVLQDLPANAEVEIDGQYITLKAADGKPIEIRVVANKKHWLEIKKAGFVAFSKEIEIGAGWREPVLVQVKLLPTVDKVAGYAPPQPPPNKEKVEPSTAAGERNPKAETKMEISTESPSGDSRNLVEKSFVLELGKSVKMEFVRIKAGSFLMGSPESGKNPRDNAKPPHEVTISRDFYLGKYTVTQEQYEAVTGSKPSWFSAAGRGKEKVAGLDTRRFPVEEVSWEDAVRFCELLKGKDARIRELRLPTEAEWEYAYRAGSKSQYYFGEDPGELEAHAWFGKNAGERTHEVGTKPPNAWNLYDMAGNVWQWCLDGNGGESNARSNRTDPLSKRRGGSRLFRGGAWNDSAERCTAAISIADAAGSTGFSLGFRVLAIPSSLGVP